MNTHLHVPRPSVVVGALLIAIGATAGVRTQSVTVEETERSVRHILERLPYYGVFDYIVFRVDRRVVHLAG